MKLYYTDPLQAVWMANKFRIRLEEIVLHRLDAAMVFVSRGAKVLQRNGQAFFMPEVGA